MLGDTYSRFTPNNDLRAYQEWDDRRETYYENRARDRHGCNLTPIEELHADVEAALEEGHIS